LRIVHQETKTGASSSSASVAASITTTSPNAQLYLAAISTRPATKVLSISGLGLNWTPVKAQCSGRNTVSVELWMALGAPAANDSVTARLESAAANAVMTVSRYTGAMARHAIGNIISANTAGVNGECSSGVDTSAYSFNLNTSLNGALAYGAVAMRNVSHTPAAGYAERAEVKSGNAGSMASLAVAERSIAVAGTVAVKGSFSSAADWAMIAVEIKPSTVVNSVNALAKPDTARNSAWLLAGDFRLLQNYPGGLVHLRSQRSKDPHSGARTAGRRTATSAVERSR
jgi:hypothetical protein